MIPPDEQWFTEYVYTDYQIVITESGAGTVEDPIIKNIKQIPPKWEKKSDMAHMHHPDCYHPDPNVRTKHHREILKTGQKPLACGAMADPRMIFIETHDKNKRCIDCQSMVESAKIEHATILAARIEKANQAKEKVSAPNE